MKSPIDRIYDALEAACDMSRYWNDPSFHCFRMFPPEVRVWPITQAIESQLSNGGLGQLLWNTFPHWRTLVDEGIQGYEWLGAAAEAEALRRYRSLLEQHEESCRPIWEKSVAQRDSAQFGVWMKHCRETLGSVDVDLFGNNEDLEARKDRVLRQRLKEILKAIRAGQGG